MLATTCQCDQPLELEPGECHRCGHAIRGYISASTRLLAAAIAEIALGHRQVGDKIGQAGGRTKET